MSKTTDNVRTQIHATIAADQKLHLERVRAFIAQPSISKENVGMGESAEHLLAAFQELGCQDARIIETQGMPAVWAKYDAGATKTLAVYSYFDTNVIGSGWKTPPQDAVVDQHKDFPQVLFGRGANNKGGLIAFLNALESIKACVGELPVNLLFIVEGEEFLGSKSLPWLIETFREELAQADALFSPKPSQSATGDVSLYLANKGALHLELACTGEAWGKGPTGGAIHSSLQGVVDSPVWRLVHALTTLYDSANNQILVEGFSEGLRTPTAEEEMLLEALAERYQGQEVSALPGLTTPERISQLANGLSGADLFRQYCFQPTLNINGIRAGYTGPGTLLWTLPTAAYTTIDIRVPADLNPQTVQEKIRAHLDAHGYPDISITLLSATMGDTPLSLKDDAFQAALRVFELWEIDPVIWPRRGAGGPTGFFSQMLGLPILNSTGLGYGSNHSEANEYLVIQGDGRVGGLVELEQSLADLMFSFASYPEAFE